MRNKIVLITGMAVIGAMVYGWGEGRCEKCSGGELAIGTIALNSRNYGVRNLGKPSLTTAEPLVEAVQHTLPREDELGPLSLEDHIRKAAQEACGRNDLGDYCVKDLIAITKVESSMMKKPWGDHGSCVGPTHIHLPSHPEITKKEAMNIDFALDKTLEWMMDKGYPLYRTHAIQCHNGCAKRNGYAEKIKKMSKRIDLNRGAEQESVHLMQTSDIVNILVEQGDGPVRKSAAQ